MTYNNRRTPHPETVVSEEDQKSWADSVEPNSGVVMFSKTSPASQKWAESLCHHQEVSLTMDKVRGDQYAFRAAAWETRNELKVDWYKESMTKSPVNKVCRYKGRCGTGCAVVHGWKFPEVL